MPKRQGKNSNPPTTIVGGNRKDFAKREAAWQRYLEMGSKRSLRALRQELGVSNQVIESYSREGNWQVRLDQHERDVVAKTAALVAEETAMARAEQIRVIRAGQKKLSTRIEQKNFASRTGARDLVSCLKDLIVLDRLLCGESTSNVSKSHEDSLAELE